MALYYRFFKAKLLGECIKHALPFKSLLNSTHLLLKAGAFLFKQRLACAPAWQGITTVRIGR
jgi:hypothetical protein